MEFLMENLPDFLEEVPLINRNKIVFQQDAISRTLDGPVWPDTVACKISRSQSTGLFLVGLLQGSHLQAAPETIEELNDKLHHAIFSIEDEVLEKTQENLLRRMRACITMDGRHFEHLLKSEEHGNADGFSRLPIQEKRTGEYDTVDIFQIENLETLPVTARNIKEEIEKDSSLLKVQQALETGKSLVPKIKHHWEAASQPFERIHIDFAGPFLGYIFLILVDAYTKWPEVHIVKNMSTPNTIDKCREIFTVFGLPQTLVSDNGRTFIAEEFSDFLKNNGIRHRRTAPYHPATNGLAERFVQTMKQSLRKLNTTTSNIKANLQKFLFHYRLMPHPELNKSPAEAMFGRKLRSRLDLMFPETNKSNNIENQLDKVRKFERGERVAAREYLDKNVKWRFGNVVSKLGTKRYLE
ncbi:uncharacterized protein K02A2.6-like [Ooceraea biroi]|uniref:uncharacterized protein K02A2.6-like n=1 Tax=Ooceraea biroi TaxID=2015173 RepID=UPI000F0778DC|nr:uncharacterized protein K02A2.6-like [Ooceraea biroi]